MKKFIIVERQEGGCDYTIGCGVRVSVVEAESMEVLIAKFKEGALGSEFSDDPIPQISSSWLGSNEYSRESVSVYEFVEHQTIPLSEWEREAKKLQEEEKKKAKEKAELAELERLQKKYKNK